MENEEPEEKKLILYRLDTEYSRPTSTEAWQKPMKKPALPGTFLQTYGSILTLILTY